jgi:hypothetical protein
MPVSDSIAQAFAEAHDRYRCLARTWATVSHQVGGLLPNSALMGAIQREGHVDLVIRCLEDECARLGVEARADSLMIVHHLNMLSTYWMGGIYETFRLLRERGIGEQGEAFALIFHEISWFGWASTSMKFLKTGISLNRCVL